MYNIWKRQLPVFEYLTISEGEEWESHFFDLSRDLPFSARVTLCRFPAISYVEFRVRKLMHIFRIAYVIKKALEKEYFNFFILDLSLYLRILFLCLVLGLVASLSLVYAATNPDVPHHSSIVHATANVTR